MEKQTTAQRLTYIMQTRNLRQADILKLTEPFCKLFDVKIGRSALSQYVAGKVEPRQDKLTILGLALSVSEAWLMGYDVPMERKATKDDTSERPILQKLIDYVYTLDEQEAERVYSALTALFGER